MSKKPGEGPPRAPTAGGKVVSIVADLTRRRVQRAHEQAATTHLRQLESAAEMSEHEAALEDMDLEEGIAWCEAEGSREAKVSWTELRSLRAMRSCMRGDTEAGFAEWAEIIAAEPTIAGTYLIRSRWLGQTDLPAALADCERAVAAEPQSAVAYARRGDLHRVLGDPDRALADYRRAVSLDRELFDVHYTMGTVLGGLGKLEEARAAYSRAIRLAPRYVEFYLGRAATLEHLGDFAGALRDFDRILELDPSREDARSHRAFCLAQISAAAGAGEGEDGEDGEDGEEGAEPTELDLAALDDPTQLVALAKMLALQGQLAAAVLAASRAIELSPDHILAHRLRAVYRSHAEEGAHAAVKADLGRAWELSPTTAIYRQEYLDYLMDLGAIDEAVTVYDRALTLEPDSAELLYERAACRVKREESFYENDLEDHETEAEKVARLTAAIADLERALELGKRDEDVYFELIRAREGLGDPAANAAEIERTLAALPDFIVVLALRESRRRHAGDLAGADADRARLVELGFQFRDD